MITIQDLTKYFGYYKSNTQLQEVIGELLIDPTNYDNQTLYQTCKKTKLELGFTNERMIREEDKDKPLIGGKPIFTHFNITPEFNTQFQKLPFDIKPSDYIKDVREKAGKPTRSIDTIVPILGRSINDQFEIDNLKIVITYEPEDSKVKMVQLSSITKQIEESTKPSK